jgi:hypothetical protein
MAANGISTLANKQLRQVAKLDLAQAKRKGQGITEGGGTWSTDGVDDDTANYYRSNNTYDLTALPTNYATNAVNDIANPDGLLPKRPWVAVGAIATPVSLEESVGGDSLVDLQVWYDGADTSTLIPNATDEGQITQWTDKSNFAHNANPDGGNAKPTYENTALQNGNGYIEFDGNDVLSVNPFTQLVSASGFTVFIVGKINTNDTATQYLGSTDQGGLSIFSDGSNWKVNVAGGVGTGPAIDNAWHIHTLVYDGSGATNADKLKYYIESTQATLSFSGTVGTTTSASAGTYYIGARQAGTSELYGYIGEVIMFNRTLTLTEYTNVQNYLENKWFGSPLSPGVSIASSVDVSALTLASGVYERTYDTYFGDTSVVSGATSADVDDYTAWLGTRTETAAGAVTSISRSGTVANYTSYTATGYFRAPATGNFTFYINSDDGSYLWFGDNALTSPQDLTEAVVQNGTLHGVTERSGTFYMVQDEYYPVFALFGNLTGPGTAVFSFASTDAGIIKTTDFTNRLFYNTATNGH